jgi:hypothetical protein
MDRTTTPVTQILWIGVLMSIYYKQLNRAAAQIEQLCKEIRDDASKLVESVPASSDNRSKLEVAALELLEYLDGNAEHGTCQEILVYALRETLKQQHNYAVPSDKIEYSKIPSSCFECPFGDLCKLRNYGMDACLDAWRKFSTSILMKV